MITSNKLLSVAERIERAKKSNEAKSYKQLRLNQKNEDIQKKEIKLRGPIDLTNNDAISIEGVLIAYNEWFQMVIVLKNMEILKKFPEHLEVNGNFRKPFYENSNGDVIIKVKVPQSLRLKVSLILKVLIGHNLKIVCNKRSYDFYPKGHDEIEDRIIGVNLNFVSLEDLGIVEFEEFEEFDKK